MVIMWLNKDRQNFSMVTMWLNKDRQNCGNKYTHVFNGLIIYGIIYFSIKIQRGSR